MRTKTANFFNNVAACNYDIILITESKLCDGFFDSELVDLEIYDIIRRDRGAGGAGGGVLALCKRQLQMRPRPEWWCDDLECIWFTIPSKSLGSSRDLHICLTYIPPDRNLPDRMQCFISNLSDITQNNSSDHFLLIGDFNLPCLNWDSTEPLCIKKGSVELQNSASNLVNTTNFLGLMQYNNFKNTCGNVLDLVFSNLVLDISKPNSSIVVEDRFHPAIEIDLKDIGLQHMQHTKSFKLCFRKGNYNAINDIIADFDCSTLYEGTVDDALSALYSCINEAIDKHVPKQIMGGRHQYPIWFTRALINMIKEKNKYHRLWKKYKNPLDYNVFALLRTRQKSLQEECYLNYIKLAQDGIKTNPKLFWSYVKSKRKGTSSYPKDMTYNNNTLKNEQDTCNAFNEFFASMFRLPADSYPDTTLVDPPYNSVTSDIVVTRDEILRLLRSLDKTKGPGSDGIPPVLVVNCADTLAEPLTIILNRSFREGVVPTAWKLADIVPIHKKGSKIPVEHYRPISVLNVFSKVMEKVVHKRVYNNISLNIPCEQHGFVKSKSTTTNLAVFTNSVLRDMDKGGQVDVIYTDFEKAFDRVDHTILLNKIETLGICGNLLRWTESYIKNRNQAVRIGNCRSGVIHVPSGVPQGSILGPLLYVAYLYDIGHCFKNSKFLLYADDKKVYKKVASIEDCELLQEDLNRLSVYYYKNRINVNADKCTYISFTRKTTPVSYSYSLNNVPLKRVYVMRDLGVLLDPKLTFHDHIECIVNKAFKSLGFILRVSKPFKDINCVYVLYFAYVRSVLEYCCSVWNPQYTIYMDMIERIQKRFINHINYRSGLQDDYESSCSRLKFMTLKDRRIVLDMKLLYNVCHGIVDCPELVNIMLSLNTPSTRTRHTRKALFHIPLVHTNYASNSISCRLPKTYNKQFSDFDIFHLTQMSFVNRIREWFFAKDSY